VNSAKVGVILDFDDTIVALSTERWRRFKLLLADFGLDEDELTSVDSRRGRSFRRLVGEKFRDDEFELFLSKYLSVLSQVQPRATPGGKSAIQRLRGRGVVVVVVSSSHSRIVRQDLDLLGIEVDAVYGSDHTLAEKPDVGYLSSALGFLAAAAVDSSNVISVGDSVTDYAMSRSICGFRGVLTGVSSRDDFVKAGLATRHIYPDLLAWVTEEDVGRV